MRHETAIFGLKNQIQKFLLSFFLQTNFEKEKKQITVTKRPYFGHKSQTQKFQLSFLGFSSQTTKTQTLLKPYSFSAFSKHKKDNFQKLNFEQGNSNKKHLAPNKNVTFGKLPDNWAQKHK